MKLYTGSALPVLGRCVVALGMFDGCHNGHKRVLWRAAAIAEQEKCPCVVWTYASHPLELVAPKRAPAPLQNAAQRLRSLEELGVDAVCLRPFTLREAETEPEDFIRRLKERVGMISIVLGRSNSFGSGARGTPAMLEGEGAKRGFSVEIVDTLRLDGKMVTSSAIRALLGEGNLRAALAMLGKCYALEGDVIPGQQLGRRMGFPTINVSLPPRGIPLRHGVYAGWADLDRNHHPCIINYGIKPTVNGGLSLEAHLLDYKGDLYGRRVSVRFFQFLRPERKFDSVQKLTEAIRLDEFKARRVLL